MGWDKARNFRVRGQLSVTGAQTLTGLTTLAGGATLSSAKVADLNAGTLLVANAIGTVVPTANGHISVAFGGGSARLYTRIGGTAYIFLGIPVP